MIGPFDWWLLIVGIAAGAALAWLVVADLRRREEDLEERERDEEAAWIAATLGAEGRRVAEDDVRGVLALHAWYLREPPRVAAPQDESPDEEVAAPGTAEDDAGAMPDDTGAGPR